MAKILYEVKQNQIDRSAAFGKWFAYVKSLETLNTRKLAKHISEHGSVYTQDVVFGVLEKFLFKNSAIKPGFKAKGIKKAGEVLDKMKMSKEERALYDRFMDNRRIALGQLTTAIMKGELRERKIQEAKIKQLEEKHNKVLQEKDSMLQEKDSMLQEKDSVIQEKDDKLQQLAQLLLKNGMTKDQIFEQTGVKL